MRITGVVRETNTYGKQSAALAHAAKRGVAARVRHEYIRGVVLEFTEPERDLEAIVDWYREKEEMQEGSLLIYSIHDGPHQETSQRYEVDSQKLVIQIFDKQTATFIGQIYRSKPEDIDLAYKIVNFLNSDKP